MQSLWCDTGLHNTARCLFGVLHSLQIASHCLTKITLYLLTADFFMITKADSFIVYVDEQVRITRMNTDLFKPCVNVFGNKSEDSLK